MTNKIKYMFSLSAIALLNITPLNSSSALAQEPYKVEVQEQTGISFVTGGVGKDEKTALEAVQNSYNLRLINADKVGHYSGDVHLIISDMKQNILLDTTSGPIFYANLPNGKYVVEGRVDSESRKQNITISDKKSDNVRFVWPQDSEE